MNNIVLDIMMGLICICCACSIIGLLFIDDVLETWLKMRERKKED